MEETYMQLPQNIITELLLEKALFKEVEKRRMRRLQQNPRPVGFNRCQNRKAG
jgi:hypothetical protein